VADERTNRLRRRWSRAALSSALLLALAGLAGCYATTSAYVEANAPVEIEAHPLAPPARRRAPAANRD
jgi:hypothetical protein